MEAWKRNGDPTENVPVKPFPPRVKTICDESFFQGDELGIDKRLDTFLLPAQINKLTDFPADLDKKTAYGYAAECMGSIWQHLKYMYIYICIHVYLYTYIS